MSNNNNPTAGHYQVVTTKVDGLTWNLFQHFCTKRGITPYQLLQMTVDTFVRYMDDHHQLTPAMETLMNVFEGTVGWKDAFNLADPEARPEVGEAIYFLQDATAKNHGARSVLVRRPWMGTADYTYNIQEMAERFFELNFPDMYRRIRAVACDLATGSIVETIDALVQEHIKEQDDRFVDSLFADCRRGDYGQPDLDRDTGRPIAHPNRVTMESMFDVNGYDITNSDED